MSDIQATINGKTFTIDVPDNVIKNKDEEFVTKAAQLHYNTKFAGGGVGKDASPSLPVSKPPDITQTPEFQKQATLGSEGFGDSLRKSVSSIGHAIMHPIDTINASFPQGSNFSADPNERFKQIEEGFKIPGSDTFYKATHGNLGGALGDVLPQLAIAAASSPKIRATGMGVGKGIINADYPRMNLPRLSLPGVIGGGIASVAGKNFWEGAGIGAGVGAAAKSIPPMVRSIGEEVPIATAGKSWLPNFGRNISPIERPNPVEFGDAAPKVGTAPLPGEIKQLGPATQVQMPPARTNDWNTEFTRRLIPKKSYWKTKSPNPEAGMNANPVNRPSNETVNRPVHREMQVQTSPEVKTATTPIVSRESPINPEVLPREAPTPTGPTPEEIEFAKENEGALRRLGVSNIDNYTGRTIDVDNYTGKTIYVKPKASKETPKETPLLKKMKELKKYLNQQEKVSKEIPKETPAQKRAKNREETVRMFAERRRKYLLEREKTRSSRAKKNDL